MKKPSKFRLLRGTVAKRQDSFIDFNNCYKGDKNVVAVNCTTVAAVYGSSGREVALAR